jgi:hypothetical protein
VAQGESDCPHPGQRGHRSCCRAGCRPHDAVGRERVARGRRAQDPQPRRSGEGYDPGIKAPSVRRTRRVGAASISVVRYTDATKEITGLAFSPFHQKPRDKGPVGVPVEAEWRSLAHGKDIRAAERGAGSDPQRKRCRRRFRSPPIWVKRLATWRRSAGQRRPHAVRSGRLIEVSGSDPWEFFNEALSS